MGILIFFLFQGNAIKAYSELLDEDDATIRMQHLAQTERTIENVNLRKLVGRICYDVVQAHDLDTQGDCPDKMTRESFYQKYPEGIPRLNNDGTYVISLKQVCYHVLTCQRSACSKLHEVFAESGLIHVSLRRAIEGFDTETQTHQYQDYQDKNILFNLGHDRLCEGIGRFASINYGIKVVLHNCGSST